MKRFNATIRFADQASENAGRIGARFGEQEALSYLERLVTEALGESITSVTATACAVEDAPQAADSGGEAAKAQPGA